MNLNLFFLFGKKEDSIDIKELGKSARKALLKEVTKRKDKEKPKKKKISKRIFHELTATDKHLKKIIGESKEAVAEEDAPQDLINNLALARRSVQSAMETLRK